MSPYSLSRAGYGVGSGLESQTAKPWQVISKYDLPRWEPLHARRERYAADAKKASSPAPQRVVKQTLLRISVQSKTTPFAPTLMPL